jgi:hypothetical protein
MFLKEISFCAANVGVVMCGSCFPEHWNSCSCWFGVKDNKGGRLGMGGTTVQHRNIFANILLMISSSCAANLAASTASSGKASFIVLPSFLLVCPIFRFFLWLCFQNPCLTLLWLIQREELGNSGQRCSQWALFLLFIVIIILLPCFHFPPATADKDLFHQNSKKKKKKRSTTRSPPPGGTTVPCSMEQQWMRHW